jgi:hypothetical protein
LTGNHGHRLAAALCLGAIGLAGCNSAQERQAQAGSGICIDFTQAAKSGPPVAPQEGPAAVEDCVRRWAFTLAPAKDDADQVADAVVAACNAPLSRWNQQTVNAPGASGEATSIITGESTTPIAEHFAYTRNRALIYVVQARAGNCRPPPAANGAPQGVG